MTMSSSSAKYGHVKRRLARRQQLTGELLQLALDAIGDGVRPSGDTLMDGISTKLKSGTALDDYELHIVVDVSLLHTRLSDAAARSRRDECTPDDICDADANRSSAA